jgi:hypothetical protein
MEQVITSCTGEPVSITCSAPYNEGTDDASECMIPAQVLVKLSLVGPASVYVTTATGAWVAYF